MKKTIVWLLALLMVLSLCACGSRGGSSGAGPGTSSGDPLARTPYQDAPQTVEEIVAGLLEGYDLPELPEEDRDYVVNLGYYDCDHMTAGPIGEAAGIYEALGMKVNVTGNGNVPQAMAAGQMDMAYCGWTTTLNAIKNGVPLFIAAENHIGGSEYLVVSNGIDIKDPGSLIGKRISFGTDPDTNNHLWVEWTSELGIPKDPDSYEGYAMSDKDEYLAMSTGSLDAYICCDPWASMAVYTGVGSIMMTFQQWIQDDPNEPPLHATCCKIAMNRAFADAHPALAQRMLLAHTISLQFIYEHPYYAAEMFSAYYGVPVEVAFMNLWRKLADEGRTLRWDINREWIENNMQHYRNIGVRDDINTLNVLDYVDTTLIDSSGCKDFETFIRENIDPVFPEGMAYEDYKARAYAVDGVTDPSQVPEYVDIEVYQKDR